MGKTESGALWLSAGTDQPLPVLSVLDQPRRRRRGQVPAVPHRPAARGDRSARRGPRGRSRQARKPAAAGRGTDAAGPRRRGLADGPSGRPRSSSAPRSASCPTPNWARSSPTCPARNCRATRLQGEGLTIVDALVEAGLAKSKGEARRIVEQGGAYVNNRRVEGVGTQLGPSATWPANRSWCCAAARRNTPCCGLPASPLFAGEGRVGVSTLDCLSEYFVALAPTLCIGGGILAHLGRIAMAANNSELNSTAPQHHDRK